MNNVILKLKGFIGSLALIVAAASLAAGQQAQPPRQSSRLQLDNLERLAASANQAVVVNVDESVLKIIPIRALLESRDPEERAAAEIIKGIKGVFVRSYEFSNEGEYNESDVAPFRAQVKQPGWAQVVSVNKREAGRMKRTVEVYLMNQGTEFGGVAVVYLEPRRLTLVNVVGNIDLDKLSRLKGNFGIPDLRLGDSDRDDDDDDEPARKKTERKP
ncbi:MAG: DUF4252 domain-containing protein [Pyrinomonadaceae bacterium]